MKKIVVLGAAGAVGFEAAKLLINSDKYEVTLLDLNNKRSKKRLKKFEKKANVIYGDIMDKSLLEKLVTTNDVIIYLVSIMPPFSNINTGISDAIEFESIKEIEKNINKYRPECHLIYCSDTTIYKSNEQNKFTIRSKVEIDDEYYYNNTKIKCEKLIKSKVKNYTIFRLPFVLSSVKNEPFMFNVNKKDTISCITDCDAGRLFANSVEHLKEINNKMYNIDCGESFHFLFKDLLRDVIKRYGISKRMLVYKMFIYKKYYSPICKDGEDYSKIDDFSFDKYENYLSRIAYISKKRFIKKFFGRIYLFLFNR